MKKVRKIVGLSAVLSAISLAGVSQAYTFSWGVGNGGSLSLVPNQCIGGIRETTAVEVDWVATDSQGQQTTGHLVGSEAHAYLSGVGMPVRIDDDGANYCTCGNYQDVTVTFTYDRCDWQDEYYGTCTEEKKKHSAVHANVGEWFYEYGPAEQNGWSRLTWVQKTNDCPLNYARNPPTPYGDNNYHLYSGMGGPWGSYVINATYYKTGC